MRATRSHFNTVKNRIVMKPHPKAKKVKWKFQRNYKEFQEMLKKKKVKNFKSQKHEGS